MTIARGGAQSTDPHRWPSPDTEEAIGASRASVEVLTIVDG